MGTPSERESSTLQKNDVTRNHKVSSRKKFLLLFCPILAYFRGTNSMSYGHALLIPKHIKSYIWKLKLHAKWVKNLLDAMIWKEKSSHHRCSWNVLSLLYLAFFLFFIDIINVSSKTAIYVFKKSMSSLKNIITHFDFTIFLFRSMDWDCELQHTFNPYQKTFLDKVYIHPL